MAIQVNLDVMLARRRMPWSELAAKVAITLANPSVLKTGRAGALRLTTLDGPARGLDGQPGDVAAGGPGGGEKKVSLSNIETGRSSARRWN